MKIPLTIMLLLIQLFGGIDSNKTELLIIGHRGAAGHAPENTIESIKLALELGANAIEIDIRQTKDKVPVAIHDDDVGRTTNGCGSVSDYSLNELQKLDAGSWFHEKFSGTKIPSLEEIIMIMKDSLSSNNSNPILIIEFKGGLGEYENIEQQTLSLLEKHNFTKSVILKSFDPNQLEKLRKLASKIPLLYVYAVRIPWLNIIIDTGVSFGSVFDFNTEFLQPHEFFLSKSFIELAHEKNIKVIVWGVNDSDDIRHFINVGVDGIETDYPDRVYNILNLKQK